MRIGVMSDSHGDRGAIRRAVVSAGDVDLWLHAGDYSHDASFLGDITNIKVVAVAGNCDGSAKAKPDEFVETLGKRIWLTHGHRYRVKLHTAELFWWARQYAADVVIYGHTHMADITWKDDVVVFNPGSIAYPRDGRLPSYGLIEIMSGQIPKARIVYLHEKQ